MIKDQLISFKTAKLAKEKGFKGGNSSYDKKGRRCIGAPVDWLLGGFKLYDAPTQSLLQRWLREEHNIDVELQGCGEFKKVRIGFMWSINGFELWDHSEYIYDKYEEALETGLFKALKLIK